MRIGLLVSLLVHGAAATTLALWGTARDAPEPPLRHLAVSLRRDAAPEPERMPDAEPALRGPPVPVESWPIPEEAPEPPEVEAPEVPAFGHDRIPPVVRLPNPLPWKARSDPPPAAATSPSRPGALVEPRRRPAPPPRYPLRARRLGIEGTVILLVHVAADGTVARAEVGESSGHEILDRAAVEAAPLWRFEPARRDGVAVSCDVRVPVEFRLEGP